MQASEPVCISWRKIPSLPHQGALSLSYSTYGDHIRSRFPVTDSPGVRQNCIPDAKCHRFLQTIQIRYFSQRVRTFRLSHCGTKHLRGGADKSLARPGRKQATATKLEIYSTNSLRSSIHFLAHCSNFCKPLKKIQKFVRPTGSPRQQ